MPTYEYVCTACGAPLEVVQSIHDAALTECPACDGGRLRKVYGNVGVVFKGSGFYRTDSRRGAQKTGQSSGSASGSTPAAGPASAEGSAPAKGPTTTSASKSRSAAPAPAATSGPAA